MVVHVFTRPTVAADRPTVLATRRTKRLGTATVEAAVVFMWIFAILLPGMFELSRAMNVAEILDDAARRGCRVAITQGKSNTDVTTAINGIMSDNGLPNATIHVYVMNQTTGVWSEANCNTAKGGDPVRVTAGIQVSDALLFWPKTLYLSSSTIESQALTMIRQYSSKDTLP